MGKADLWNHDCTTKLSVRKNSSYFGQNVQKAKCMNASKPVRCQVLVYAKYVYLTNRYVVVKLISMFISLY